MTSAPTQPFSLDHRQRATRPRASNAAAARALGVPVDGLPRLTTQQAYDLARRLSGVPVPPDEPG